MSKRNAGSGATDAPLFTVKYVVRKRFKYNDTYLEPGQEFRPGAGKFDESIISRLDDRRLVDRVESAVPDTRAARQRVRKEKA